jgi:GAF domain-containing protein
MQQAIDTEMLIAQGRALIDGERDGIANAANLSALVFEALPGVNWAGVYLLRGGELVLGPFQGKPACTRIAIGEGVCGTAAAERRTVVVPDVHAFAGHIACDSASRSEIVVPFILRSGELVGVFDVDSPLEDRFHDDERRLVETLAQLLVDGSDFR